MKKLIIVFICYFLVSCGENNEVDRCGENTTPPITGFSLNFTNTLGVDLLNPNTANGFKKSAVKVFSDSSLTKEPLIGNKSLFYIYKPKEESQYRFSMQLPIILFTNDKLTLYLKLSDTVADKIEVEAKTVARYNSNSCYYRKFILKKLIYNGQLVYEYGKTPYQTITIIKKNM